MRCDWWDIVGTSAVNYISSNNFSKNKFKTNVLHSPLPKKWNKKAFLLQPEIYVWDVIDEILLALLLSHCAMLTHHQSVIIIQRTLPQWEGNFAFIITLKHFTAVYILIYHILRSILSLLKAHFLETITVQNQFIWTYDLLKKILFITIVPMKEVNKIMWSGRCSWSFDPVQTSDAKFH